MESHQMTPDDKRGIAEEEHREMADTDVVAAAPVHSQTNEEIHEATATESNVSSSTIVTGHRLHLLVLALCITLSQSTLETTIVSTSLVSITDALNGFEQRDWVVTSYLLTYTSFLIIWARFSDVLGLKTMLLVAVTIFVVFSAACGAAQSITELIVLRAFQGLGGAGIAANVTVAVSKIVPRDRVPKYVAAVSSVTALSSILGPVLGGVINVHGQWRWIFLFNVPLGAVAFVMLVILMPSQTPLHDLKTIMSSLRTKFASESLAKLDVLGAFLLLVPSALLVFALEEGGTRYPWSHPVIVSTFVLSGVTFTCFIFWELHLGRAQEQGSTNTPLPVFPVLLLKDRVVAGLVLTSFLTGFPYVSLTVNIPQRLQVINDESALIAGLALLPFLLVTSLAAPVAAILLSKLRTPPVLILLGGSLFQLLGVSLLCTLPTAIPASATAFGPAPPLDSTQFGFEVLMGIGFGALLTCLVVLTQHGSVLPLTSAGQHRAVMLAAVPQLRVLAGTVSLAVCATLLNNHVSAALKAEGFGQDEIQALANSLSAGIETLGRNGELQKQALARSVFAEGYRRQFVALSGFSAVTVLSVALMAGRRMMGRYTGQEEETEVGKGGKKEQEEKKGDAEAA